MVFQVVGLLFVDDPPADRMLRAQDAVGVPADQWMPFRQRFAFGQQTIGTGIRHPIEFFAVFRGQCDAIWDPGGAVWVVTATAAIEVQQVASNIGIPELAGRLVFQLVQAAFGATVTECFPLFF